MLWGPPCRLAGFVGSFSRRSVCVAPSPRVSRYSRTLVSMYLLSFTRIPSRARSHIACLDSLQHNPIHSLIQRSTIAFISRRGTGFTLLFQPSSRPPSTSSRRLPSVRPRSIRSTQSVSALRPPRSTLSPRPAPHLPRRFLSIHARLDHSSSKRTCTLPESSRRAARQRMLLERMSRQYPTWSLWAVPPCS